MPQPEIAGGIASRVTFHARSSPDRPAIIAASLGKGIQSLTYTETSFAQLDGESDQIARGLLAWGVKPGMRLVLLVPFGPRFISLVLGLLKAGVVTVLVDPGMGRSKILHCLRELNPDGFVAIPQVQLVRWFLRRHFPNARWNVTIGPFGGIGGMTWSQLLAKGTPPRPLPTIDPTDDAAVIFTTGSTGPPKGVAYTHAIFHHQVELIQSQYGIQPGDRDLACFPLFGLFDCLMGVTTVVPRMDATRPAAVDPRCILDAVRRWQTTQAFGSPALWNTVVRYCLTSGDRLDGLRLVLSAGAPVPPHVLQGLRNVLPPEAKVFTPYGATEALPVASIESRTILEETVERTRAGAGTCVGSLYPSMRWMVIRISDDPIAERSRVEPLPNGEIGELMVAGPVVTQRYVTRSDQNAFHKVKDNNEIWHRMGDVGYLDEGNRFWFCGRKSHRVQSSEGTLYTEPCEAILNGHPKVYRSALVGIGPRGAMHPVLVVEPWPEHRPRDASATDRFLAELRQWLKQYPLTESIEDVRVFPRTLPVDIRHNSKIFREQVATWAAEEKASGV